MSVSDRMPSGMVEAERRRLEVVVREQRRAIEVWHGRAIAAADEIRRRDQAGLR